MIILRLFFNISGFPPLWCNNVTVLTHSLLNKGPIGNELLVLHEILIKNMKFINKLFNLRIFLSCTDMESRIRIDLKYVSDIAEVYSIKGFVALKLLSIYQYHSK